MIEHSIAGIKQYVELIDQYEVSMYRVYLTKNIN